MPFEGCFLELPNTTKTQVEHNTQKCVNIVFLVLPKGMPLKLCMRPQLLGLFLTAHRKEPRLLTEGQSGEIIPTERICEGTLETMDRVSKSLLEFPLHFFTFIFLSYNHK